MISAIVEVACEWNNCHSDSMHAVIVKLEVFMQKYLMYQMSAAIAKL